MIDRWTIGEGIPPGGARAIALDLDEQHALRDAGISCVRFDEVLEDEGVEPGDEVVVRPPQWRGYAFVELLEWLVCARLAVAGRTRVTWLAGKREGATGVRRILTDRGWDFDESKDRSVRRFDAIAPSSGPRPQPRSFPAELGGRTLTFCADWGTFSRERIDDGTRVLFDSAAAAIARGPGSVGCVVDIGTGYGPLAIGLVGAGLCEEAIGTEIDFVSMHLARVNASAAGVAATFVTQADPAQIAPSPITVCELPTHTTASETDRLVRGLARRSLGGLVLMAVHAGIEARYAKLFSSRGGEPKRVALTTHAVLALGELPRQ